VLSLRNLRPCTDRVVAVTRPAAIELQAQLSAKARVIENQHPEGLSTSLACGVRVTQAEDGWVIALADIPGSSGYYRARCRFFTPRRGGGNSDLDGEM
jgi:CTP:molybdopterin cytidylyltransferase MocA